MTGDTATVDVRALARSGAVHFMGIAGAGMSALAELIARDGGTVTGCDTKPGPVGDALRAHGMRIETGHDAAHVRDAAALVITSAVPQDHPELNAARERGIPVLKRAQVLGSIVNAGMALAVAGTHGKTTTTAATTAILEAAQLDPTGLVGGRMDAWGGGLRAGGSDIYVVEADEYDRSFLTLHPAAAVVTNIEADHLDIYGDLTGLEQGFVDFLQQVTPAGLIGICIDDEGARRIAGRVQRDVMKYGTSSDADLRAVDIHQQGRTMTFNVVERGNALGTLQLAVPGVHNVRNALAAFALARFAGASFDAARTALSEFTGVARRFQEIGTAHEVTVIDDYAHHPTEITATLSAARGMYPRRRIVAVFQPHLYSRTRDLSEQFGQSLAAADAVWVCDVYAAREKPIPGISGDLVARAARAAGAARVNYVPERDELFLQLRGTIAPGDVIVAMGAGDIDEATHQFYQTLAHGVIT
jgi:UDP-N-acetylmuramate--alanine ligase